MAGGEARKRRGFSRGRNSERPAKRATAAFLTIMLLLLSSGLLGGVPVRGEKAAADIGGEPGPALQVPGSDIGVDLAFGRPVKASSRESWWDHAPKHAVDGDPNTYWASKWSDPQWFYVDLGKSTDVSSVILRWHEWGYAKSYQIQVSDDAVNWATIYSTSSGDGGLDEINGLKGSGRYVRVHGSERGTFFSYALYEFKVYRLRLVNLSIEPDLVETDMQKGWGTTFKDGVWEGWATYDIVGFKAVPTWSDHAADPDCTRAGSPRWSCDYGWFEGDKGAVRNLTMDVAYPEERMCGTTGKEVLWSTDIGNDAWGKVEVAYGGLSSQVAVHAKNPLFGIPMDYLFYLLEQKIDPLDASFYEFLRNALGHALHPEEYYQQRVNEAHQISDRLEDYIRKWLKGEVPSELPRDLLPYSLNNDRMQWELVHPEEVQSEEQWGIRDADLEDIDFDRGVHSWIPDKACTFGQLWFLAPFGSRLVLEGDFPHARFLDYEIAPPFDPRFPYSPTGIGNAEVPIVDADIEPDPGHVNPFRVGADRTAANRRYHVYFQLEEGNSYQLNEALNPGSMTETPLTYRTPTSTNNTRVGGPMIYWGYTGSEQIIPSLLWMRIYLPDRDAGPLGGVALPKAHLELSSGERFWIRPKPANMKRYIRRANLPFPTGTFLPREMHPRSGAGLFDLFYGIYRAATGFALSPSFTNWNSSVGWGKPFGVLLGSLEMSAVSALGVDCKFLGFDVAGIVKPLIRALDRLLAGRGPDQPPPGSLESSSTVCKYNNYLSRYMTIEEGKVLVLTGKLPRTPRTYNGETVMEDGELRFFSITHYADTILDYGGVCDAQIATDEEGRYIIVMSRAKDRPANAKPEYGVTWNDWGPSSATQYFLIRFMSVAPEWRETGKTPDMNNLPWEKADWAQPGYDRDLIGNNRPGALGDWHPVLHYMSKEEFERLGTRLDPRNIPHTDDW